MAKLQDFKPQRKNANKHTPRGMKLLEDSIQQGGWIGAITSSADGEVFAGSARLEKIGEVMPNDPLVVHTTGDRPVIVVRDDIPNADDPRAVRLALADNRIQQVDLDFDVDMLASIREQDASLLDNLWYENELVDLGVMEAESKDAEPQVDRAAELLEKWQVKTGDLWQIGDHRLICGDCTDPAVVERVMGGEKAVMTFIDPPYNALKSWNKDEAHSETRLDPSDWFENDNMEWDDYWKFMEVVFLGLQGHSIYVCCDFRIYDGFKPRIEQAGYKVKHCIVWKKNVWGLGKRYRFQHEFIIYATKKDAPWYGGHSESDVWEVDAVRGANVDHNTPKPMELPYRAMKCSTLDNNIFFDGFCGSGTSLVAGQNLQRVGRAVEQAPKNCAVTLERMEQAFGISGVLIE